MPERRGRVFNDLRVGMFKVTRVLYIETVGN
jgi:hypothetical protein